VIVAMKTVKISSSKTVSNPDDRGEKKMQNYSWFQKKNSTKIAELLKLE